MHNGDVMPVFVQIYLPNHGEIDIKFGVRNLYVKLWAVLILFVFVQYYSVREGTVQSSQISSQFTGLSH